MKKPFLSTLAGILTLVLVLSVTTVGYASGAEAQSPTSNILIAYFSRVGNTDFPDDIDAVTSASLLKNDGKLYGNTQYIASLIQQHTGGDLFLIQTENKYPSVYEQIDQQGGEENRNRIRPKLASHVENMDEYSVIFLGYPIWYYDMPMAVYSFLEEYDLSGKTIIPFVTSGASGFTGTLDTLRELQPNAEVQTDGFDVKHSRVAEVQAEDVNNWIDSLAYFSAFSDVPADAWYAGAVAYCRQRGVMNGTTDTTFAPEASLTRAMLAAVLYRMSGSPTVAAPPAFTDAAAGAWYSSAVSWAAETGVISGYGGGIFGVNDPTTREQAITILWRYAGNLDSPAALDISDANAISSWAQTAVRRAEENGILAGMITDRRFDPKAKINRGEVASLLYHYLRNQA